jgi:hypothetical protein
MGNEQVSCWSFLEQLSGLPLFCLFLASRLQISNLCLASPVASESLAGMATEH